MCSSSLEKLVVTMGHIYTNLKPFCNYTLISLVSLLSKVILFQFTFSEYHDD